MKNAPHNVTCTDRAAVFLEQFDAYVAARAQLRNAEDGSGNPAARTEVAPRIRRCTAPASSGVFVTDSSGKMTYTCYTCGASGDGASLVDCRYGPSNKPEG